MADRDHFAPLPDGFGKDPTKGGKFLDVEVFGGIAAGGTITGETISGGTIAGSAISGSTVTGGSVIGSDFYSDNWDGTIPLSLASRDAGASAGFGMDGSAGGAQFVNIFADGGELRTLSILGELTMGTGGIITMGAAGEFRTAASGARLSIAQATLDRIFWYTGDGAETNPGRLQMSAAAGSSLLQLYAPQMAGNWPFLAMIADAGDSEIQLSTDQVTISENVVVTGRNLSAAQGAAGDPDYSFNSDPNTGMFLTAADTIGLSAGGSEGIAISPTYLFSLGNAAGEPAIRHSAAGSVATPTYAWVSNLDMGMYRVAADQIGWGTVGIARMSLNAARLDVDSTFLQLPVKATTGDPASPANGDTYVNTNDNKIRTYADGAWRDLVTW